MVEEAQRLTWRKSTRSSAEGPNCVELAAINMSPAAWRKSSRSAAQGNCVEVADAGRAVAVRDSKNPDGGTLAFTRREMAAFARRVRRGDVDR